LNYIIRTIDGLEHTLEGVAPLTLTSGGEYVFYDEGEKDRVTMRAPIRSVTAIVDRSQYKGHEPAVNLEAKINQTLVPQKIRENVLKEAKQSVQRYIVRPLETKQDKKLQIFDTAEIEAHPIEIELPQLPKWPLKTTPKEYLKKYPTGKHSTLARSMLIPIRALVETIVHLANETYQRKVTEEDPNEPVLTITVRDIGSEPLMTMPANTCNAMLESGELQPVMSPVWEKQGLQVRPQQLEDGQIRLWPCRMEFGGRVKPERVNLNVPRDSVK